MHNHASIGGTGSGTGGSTSAADTQVVRTPALSSKRIPL